MPRKLNQISRLVLLIAVSLLGLKLALAQKNEPVKPPDQSPHSNGFVTANGIKMQYLDWGGKGDVLLLLAGLGNDAHVFDDFATKFTDRFRVIGLTRRGFGESDKPPTGYDTATRVEDIRRFLDQMKIKKVSLIGHSMAGDEMTVFASLYPKRVRKLVYLDAAYDRADSTKLLFADPYIPPLFKRIGLDAVNSPQAAEVVVPVMPPPEIYKIFVAYYKAMIAFHIDYTKVKAPALAFFAVTEQPHPAITPQTDEETRKKLSDWVKENLTPLNRRSIEQFRKEMRRGQAVEMKDATHYIFLGETADEVVRQTREFLLSTSNRIQIEEKFRRVENGLLMPFSVKGEPNTMLKLAERMQFYKVPSVSVAVINNGKIEWAKGYGVQETGGKKSISTETLFQAASISKPITAMAMLRLVQENKLNLDEDVNKKLVSWKVPDNDFTKEQKVTLRGLLSHSASLTVSGFRGYAANEEIPTILQILDGKTPSNSIPIRVDGTPNKDFRYAGGGYVVVQKLAEDVTKKPFPEFMQAEILKKLKMNHSTFGQPLPTKFQASTAVGHSSDGAKIKGDWYIHPEMAAAGLWTTPSDLARFAIEIQKSKSGKSNKILSVEMVNEILTPQIGGWGLGLELRGKNQSARFGHGGGNEGYRCLMFAYSDSGQGAVVMTNSDNGDALAEEIMRSIAKEYGWFEYLPKEKIIVSVDRKIYDSYAGQYQIAPNYFLTIANENGKLFSQMTGQPKVELFAESETDFFLKESETEIKFVKNTQGVVTGLVWRERERDTFLQKTK